MSGTTLQTPYGVFSGVISAENYENGKLQGIRLEDRNVIVTHAGELIPFYGGETLRRKHKASVTFHRNGMIKAVALEEQQEVVTPIGELPAELLTFYDTGEVHRVFPLDGKISGFWSEEDERALGIPLSFDLGFTAFTALISGICFYKDGQIRSVTLFPGEQIEIALSQFGSFKVRYGFSLSDIGALESLEPAEPVKLKTPIGFLTAYDVNAHGICADTNSLYFDEQGRIIRLATSEDRITVRKAADASLHYLTPAVIAEDDEGKMLPIPLEIAFDYDERSVSISGQDGTQSFSFDDEFFIMHGSASGCGAACSECSGCSLGGKL